jgi:amphi-Trp domain-containing protein
VPAGIDGEAAKLEPPLSFRIRPGVLRVRVSRRHPGASPSAMLPETAAQSVRALAGIVAGRDPAIAPAGDDAVPPTDHEGDLMDVFEVEQKERVSREEVAARLRTLADMLERHNDIEFERGGMRFTVHVPDEVELKIELEVESDERELEIDLTW